MSYDLELAVEKLLRAEASLDELAASREGLAEWRETLDELRENLAASEAEYSDIEARIAEAERGYAAEAARAREQVEMATARAMGTSEPDDIGPIERCRTCGREEWGHSWLDHVK